jgi:hypothetical protein
MLMAWGGCGSASRHAESIGKNPVGVMVVSTEPATRPIEASHLFPSNSGEQAFVVLDDAGKPGGRVLVARTASSEHGANMAVAEGDRRTEYMTRLGSGEVALTAVIDHAENALTLFNPPLVVSPVKLAPGDTFTSEASMRIVDVNRPAKQREHGAARRTMTYANDAVITTPDGAQRRVARIEIHFNADLRFANADERTIVYVAREDGLIASDSDERITILGAFPRQTRRVLVRQ